MEMYLYQCPICGFTHQVPAYWVSFSPEKIYEFPHINLASNVMCEHFILDLVAE